MFSWSSTIREESWKVNLERIPQRLRSRSCLFHSALTRERKRKPERLPKVSNMFTYDPSVRPVEQLHSFIFFFQFYAAGWRTDLENEKRRLENHYHQSAPTTGKAGILLSVLAVCGSVQCFPPILSSSSFLQPQIWDSSKEVDARSYTTTTTTIIIIRTRLLISRTCCYWYTASPILPLASLWHSMQTGCLSRCGHVHLKNKTSWEGFISHACCPNLSSPPPPCPSLNKILSCPHKLSMQECPLWKRLLLLYIPTARASSYLPHL